jgi:hypothetical protein
MRNKKKKRFAKHCVLYKRLHVILLLMAWGIYAPSVAVAQKVKEIRISGQVVDPENIPLSGVLVDVKETLTFTLTDVAMLHVSQYDVTF